MPGSRPRPVRPARVEQVVNFFKDAHFQGIHPFRGFIIR